MTENEAPINSEPGVRYNVQLFVIGALEPDQPYALEKLTPTGEYDQIQRNDNLFNVTEDLRLIIEDNTTRGKPVPKIGAGHGTDSRSQFYKANDLLKFLNVFVKMLVEVRKFEGSSNDAKPIETDEVQAMFEVVDPPEDVAHIKGPRPGARTGQKFVKEFVDKVTRATGADNDNCIRDFAETPYNTRCRVEGKPLVASDVLYHYPALQPLPNDPADKKVGGIKISRDRDSKGKPVGYATVLFHPPPVLGDNYKLKVTIKDIKGHPMPLAEDSGDPSPTTGASKREDFHTSTITVWKRVKIHMIAYQESVDMTRPDAYPIKWDEVKNAYSDAFIEVEKPPQERIVPVSEEEWMNYLDEFVYGAGARAVNKGFKWRRDLWNIYKDKSVNDNTLFHADFAKYSFPQIHPVTYEFRSEESQIEDKLREIARLVGWDLEQLYRYDVSPFFKNNEDWLKAQKDVGYPPPIRVSIPTRLNPSQDDDPTSTHFLHLLAVRILHDKLGEADWRKVVDQRAKALGNRLGLCVLLCKPPNDDTTVQGDHIGGKIFFMHETDYDVTLTFVHEMGHALFLNHGATDAIANDLCVVSTEREGAAGPYFEEHCSEDMMSCLMSYENDRYGARALGRGAIPVEWHFCGVCLLNLRLYNIKRMLDSDESTIFKKLQYNLKPTIVYLDEDGNLNEGYLDEQLNYHQGCLPPMPKDSWQTLLARYPQEGVHNNDGKDCYKDISFLGWMEQTTHICSGTNRRLHASWHSTNEDVAKVSYTKIGDYWYSRLHSSKTQTGSTNITFTVAFGPKPKRGPDTLVVTSDPFRVTVK